MSIKPINRVIGKAVPILGDDIDTDRIIPARYLKCVTFDGIGEFAFYDERFDSEGKPKKHPLNDNRFKDASIIIAGNNFGCGSSREHAPQSIKRAGFNAIIAESFAEIFYGNSTTLGLVCVTLPKTEIEELAKTVDANPNIQIEIDIEREVIRAGEKVYNCGIKPSTKKSFLDGEYDSLGVLLKNMDKVKEVEKNLPYSFA
ncbi:3-isopropylmalate dehydratase small subunit [Deferribacterales bacterium Es71-Z0220]|uniref:3-isopropylmalate dehydratase small subunit n=1 Tax=Deferrivibrio essentukiensis TaxID=2880922 RepID=UPI001F60D9EB|nr:3-isopropylmalate dehydratase small subunit [Deferrivibrio essentukiensis]MCB4203861.1 3-isopropylmalate dehydratase small subunit [Deferrivibrio essentukiensis]